MHVHIKHPFIWNYWDDHAQISSVIRNHFDEWLKHVRNDMCVCAHAHVFTGHSYIIAAPPLSPSAAAYPAAAVAARSARLRSTDVMTFAGCNGHSLVHCLGRHIDFPLKRFHVLAKTRESGWQNG